MGSRAGSSHRPLVDSRCHLDQFQEAFLTKAMDFITWAAECGMDVGSSRTKLDIIPGKGVGVVATAEIKVCGRVQPQTATPTDPHPSSIFLPRFTAYPSRRNTLCRHEAQALQDLFY